MCERLINEQGAGPASGQQAERGFFFPAAQSEPSVLLSPPDVYPEDLEFFFQTSFTEPMTAVFWRREMGISSPHLRRVRSSLTLPLVPTTSLLFATLLLADLLGAPVNVLADSTVLSNCNEVGLRGAA